MSATFASSPAEPKHHGCGRRGGLNGVCLFFVPCLSVLLHDSRSISGTYQFGIWAFVVDPLRVEGLGFRL